MEVQNMQSIVNLGIGRHNIHWKAWKYQQTERRAGRIGSGLEKFCRGLGIYWKAFVNRGRHGDVNI